MSFVRLPGRVSVYDMAWGCTVFIIDEAFGDAWNEIDQSSFHAFFVLQFLRRMGRTVRFIPLITMNITRIMGASLSSLALLCSCSSGKLVVPAVGYQSVRTVFAQPEEIPASASIGVIYFIAPDGKLSVYVRNLSDRIMTIDKTRSFFIDTDGKSRSYYDSTVHSNTDTEFSSDTRGVSVNLGAVAGFLGIGGPLGGLLGGIGVSGSNTGGLSSSHTSYVTDSPLLQIGPKGEGDMHWAYPITGVGCRSINDRGINHVWLDSKTSPLKFSVCVSYSLDGGDTYEKVVTEFYVNSMFTVPVTNGYVNEGFRQIYTLKPDALAEPYFIINIAQRLNGKKDASKLAGAVLKRTGDTRSVVDDLKGVDGLSLPGGVYQHGVLFDFQ